MKWIIFISLFCFSISKAQNSPLSEVELQWEEDARAIEYQLEIKDMSGKVLKTIKTKSGTFNIKMPVNKYMVRGRFKTMMDNLSPWSESVELVVPPKKVTFPKYKDNELSFAPNPRTLVANVVLNWSPSPNAEKYIFKIKDEDGAVIKEIIVGSPSVKIKLPAGKYRYSVTSISKNGFNSEEAQPDHLIFVDTAILEKPTYKKIASESKSVPLKLAIDKYPARSVYGELFYSPFLGEKWEIVEQYKPIKNYIWQAKDKLKPGRYEIYLWAVGARAKNSEKAKEYFEIKPLEKDLEEL